MYGNFRGVKISYLWGLTKNFPVCELSFTVIMGCMRIYRFGTEWEKIDGIWFSLLTNDK